MEIREAVEALASLIYPAVCQVCRAERAGAAEGYVCGACRATIRPVEPPFCERCGLPFEGALTTDFECANCREMELHFDSARSAVKAGETLLDVVHRYKYEQALWFERHLAELLCDAAERDLRNGGWNAVVPVPLHPLRLREREFNQAERLARALALRLGIPLETRWLQRSAPTLTQTRLSRQQRLANVKRAFRLRPGTVLQGKSCVLVDDVLTTGATTSACAAALKRAGAERVCVWTVARAVFVPEV